MNDHPSVPLAAVRPRYADAAVAVVDLSVRLAGRLIFENVNLRVEHGESVAIVGPSGSGKSTLLEFLLGQRPGESTGEVRVDRNRVSLVTQDGALLDHLSVIDNLRLVAAYRSRQWDDRELIASLAHLNIPATYATRPVYTLSGGEKRRVAISRALVRDPDILCFDEPDAGLDPANVRDLALALRDLQETEGKTVILATHDSLLAGLASQHVYQLANGRLSSEAVWPAPPLDEDDLDHRRRVIETLESEPVPQTVIPRAAPGTNMLRFGREILTGLALTLLSPFRRIPSFSFYGRIAFRTLRAAAIGGFVFFFLVGAMLGATTIVVIKNVSDHAIPEILTLVIKRDFVLHQLDGLYIAYFSPAIGGILYIARSGSIMTSWLGALSFGRQLDALRSLGVNPDLYLRSPVFIALMVSYVLTVAVFGCGMWVGSFATMEHLYHIPGAGQQLMLDWYMLRFADVPPKVALYSLLISAVICALGMAAKRNVDTVARHTTQTIIFTTVAIALAELGFALRA